MLVHAEIVDSDAITELVFDSQDRSVKGSLRVTFTSGGQYEYYGVRYSDFVGLLGADSIGAHFALTIKPFHSVSKV